jgi:hypothetical protein
VQERSNPNPDPQKAAATYTMDLSAIESATSPSLLDVDYGLNASLCNRIVANPSKSVPRLQRTPVRITHPPHPPPSPTPPPPHRSALSASASLRKRLAHANPKVAQLALELLSSLLDASARDASGALYNAFAGREMHAAVLALTGSSGGGGDVAASAARVLNDHARACSGLALPFKSAHEKPAAAGRPPSAGGAGAASAPSAASLAAVDSAWEKLRGDVAQTRAQAAAAAAILVRGPAGIFAVDAGAGADGKISFAPALLDALDFCAQAAPRVRTLIDFGASARDVVMDEGLFESLLAVNGILMDLAAAADPLLAGKAAPEAAGGYAALHGIAQEATAAAAAAAAGEGARGRARTANDELAELFGASQVSSSARVVVNPLSPLGGLSPGGGLGAAPGRRPPPHNATGFSQG